MRIAALPGSGGNATSVSGQKWQRVFSEILPDQRE
jgi:hypothetical protein